MNYEELKKDKDFDKLLTFAAKLIVNPDDPELKNDIFFVEKKEIILELFEKLSMPKLEAKKVLSFPSKDQLKLRELHGRITGVDKVT